MSADPPPFGPRKPPFCLVVSGPSGVGKNAVCDGLLAKDATLAYSVSATTRPPRSDEREGVDYHFWSEDRFRKEVDAGHFLESAEVHGHLYGTPRGPVERWLGEGKTPLLNLDVQGGRSVKRLLPDAVLVFLSPPSLEELERRLRTRNADTEAAIARRLRDAREELRAWVDYDYQVVNDALRDAVEDVWGILRAERARTARVRAGAGN